MAGEVFFFSFSLFRGFFFPILLCLHLCMELEKCLQGTDYHLIASDAPSLLCLSGERPGL